MIYDILEQLNISYEKVTHPPVANSEDGNRYYAGIDVGKSKNVFLRNRKGDKHYLIIILSDKNINLETLAAFLGEKRLGLASPERLRKYLNQSPGAVSPFGLSYETSNSVKVIIDSDVLEHEKLVFHPENNESGLIISNNDFIRYLESTENDFNVIKL